MKNDMRKSFRIKACIATLLMLLAALLPAVAQNKQAYALYRANGKRISYLKMVRELEKNDVILFGELHNNPVAHWLQYEVVESLHRTRDLVLGAEMFEADNQGSLDMYLAGEIDGKGLDTLARVWPNYATDYKPLVDFAREKRLRFIATNIPRRYANLVFRKDFAALDSLSAEEKNWMAPLPIAYDPELPGYARMTHMMEGHSRATLPKAQAVKDATMAYFLLKNRVPGHLFIHFNGAYHSDHYEGILWYLRRGEPDLNYITITTVSQDDVTELSAGNIGRADFILCVDENMTATY